MASRALVNIGATDALAPNWRQGISCANVDLSFLEYAETKTMVISSNRASVGYKKFPLGNHFSFLNR